MRSSRINESSFAYGTPHFTARASCCGVYPLETRHRRNCELALPLRYRRIPALQPSSGNHLTFDIVVRVSDSIVVIPDIIRLGASRSRNQRDSAFRLSAPSHDMFRFTNGPAGQRELETRQIG